MKTIHRLQPTLPTPVSDRRVTSGKVVRFFYAVGLIAVFGYFSYYFGQVLIFFEGPGVVMADVTSISVPFTSHIKNINVVPGVRIDKGEEIASVYSPDVNNEISRLLTSIAAVDQRQEELKAKIDVSESTKDLAKMRSLTARNAEQKVLSSRPDALNTAYKLEVMREAAAATQSLSQLVKDREGSVSELSTLEKIRFSLEKQLVTARDEYNDGKILSPMAGIVGSRTAHAGETLVPGQNVADIYDDTKSYIRWLMPYTKWRRPKVDDAVYVLFGNNYLKGYIWEVSSVTDLLENKRTSVLREPEQGQVVKIKMDYNTEILPVGAQVQVRMMYFSGLEKLYDVVSHTLRSNYINY